VISINLNKEKIMRKLLKSIVAVGSIILPGSQAIADGETIAVFTKNQTNPYFQAVRVGADQAAKALGAKTTHYIPTKPDSIPEQMSQIEDVIVKKPDAIVFVPVDYKAMVAGINKINAAAIPVTNVTDRVAGGKSVAFVGADDYSLGLETARFLIKTMGGKGNLIILEGVKGSLTNVDRVRGFNDAIKEAGSVKLLASQPANYQHLQAMQVMENLMQAHAAIDGVLAANDAMAIGAIEALDGANRKALVVGINGTKEGVDAIKAGKLLASGDYNGFLQGCIGTAIAIRSLRKESVPTEIVLKPTVVEKSNYQPYDVALDARSCPKWDEIASLGATTKQ
jgi:ribose transport system substrate-binding protein